MEEDSDLLWLEFINSINHPDGEVQTRKPISAPPDVDTTAKTSTLFEDADDPNDDPDYNLFRDLENIDFDEDLNFDEYLNFLNEPTLGESALSDHDKTNATTDTIYGFSSEQLLILQNQIRFHVQALTQSWIISSHDAQFQPIAEKSKEMLIELRSMKGIECDANNRMSNSNSVLMVENLQSALSLIDESGKAIAEAEARFKFSLPSEYSRKIITSRRDIFIYDWAFPWKRFSTGEAKTKNLFTLAQDYLIASMLAESHKSVRITNGWCKKLQEKYLPDKSIRNIIDHIKLYKNLYKKNSKLDSSMKTDQKYSECSNNPIICVLRDGKLPKLNTCLDDPARSIYPNRRPPRWYNQMIVDKDERELQIDESVCEENLPKKTRPITPKYGITLHTMTTIFPDPLSFGDMSMYTISNVPFALQSSSQTASVSSPIKLDEPVQKISKNLKRKRFERREKANLKLSCVCAANKLHKNDRFKNQTDKVDSIDVEASIAKANVQQPEERFSPKLTTKISTSIEPEIDETLPVLNENFISCSKLSEIEEQIHEKAEIADCAKSKSPPQIDLCEIATEYQQQEGEEESSSTNEEKTFTDVSFPESSHIEEERETEEDDVDDDYVPGEDFTEEDDEAEDEEEEDLVDEESELIASDKIAEDDVIDDINLMDDDENDLMALMEASWTAVTNRTRHTNFIATDTGGDNPVSVNYIKRKSSIVAKHRDSSLLIMRDDLARAENDDDDDQRKDLLVNYYLKRAQKILTSSDYVRFLHILVDFLHQTSNCETRSDSYDVDTNMRSETDIKLLYNNIIHFLHEIQSTYANVEASSTMDHLAKQPNDKGVQELAELLVLFLDFRQAQACGEAFNYLYWKRVFEFIRKVEVYLAYHYSKRSQQLACIQRLIKSLSQINQQQLTNDAEQQQQTKSKIKSVVSKILNGHILLMEEFSSLFLDDLPPQYLYAEQDDFDEFALVSDNATAPDIDESDFAQQIGAFENVSMSIGENDLKYGTNQCPCKHCHTPAAAGGPVEEIVNQNFSSHCALCSVRFIAGRIYLPQFNSVTKKMQLIEYVKSDEMAQSDNHNGSSGGGDAQIVATPVQSEQTATTTSSCVTTQVEIEVEPAKPQWTIADDRALLEACRSIIVDSHITQLTEQVFERVARRLAVQFEQRRTVKELSDRLHQLIELLTSNNGRSESADDAVDR